MIEIEQEGRTLHDDNSGVLLADATRRLQQYTPKMPKVAKIKRTKKKVVKPLPKKIRNELTLCCALKGYNTLAICKSQRLKDQYKTMATFYHGRQPNHPSQIKLLCAASYTYRRLFNTTTSIALKKIDTTSSISPITLKTELT